jgi:peptide/nickel transport system permease protein
MGTYIFRRLLAVLAVLLAVSVLVFAVSSLLPANVAYLILGPFAPPEQVRALELRLGLCHQETQECVRRPVALQLP